MPLAHVPYAEVAATGGSGFDSVRFAVGPAMRAVPAVDQPLQQEFSFTSMDEHEILRHVARHVVEATGIDADLPTFRRDGTAKSVLREWVAALRFGDEIDECGIQVVDVTSKGRSGMVLVMASDIDLERCLRRAAVDAKVVRFEPEQHAAPAP